MLLYHFMKHTDSEPQSRFTFLDIAMLPSQLGIEHSSLPTDFQNFTLLVSEARIAMNQDGWFQFMASALVWPWMPCKKQEFDWLTKNKLIILEAIWLVWHNPRHTHTCAHTHTHTHIPFTCMKKSAGATCSPRLLIFIKKTVLWWQWKVTVNLNWQ